MMNFALFLAMNLNAAILGTVEPEPGIVLRGVWTDWRYDVQAVAFRDINRGFDHAAFCVAGSPVLSVTRPIRQEPRP